jgi:hypothetical protein
MALSITRRQTHDLHQSAPSLPEGSGLTTPPRLLLPAAGMCALPLSHFSPLPWAWELQKGMFLP